MNAIERYFSDTGDTATSLAGRIGRSPSTLTRAINGQRNASMKLARQVEAGTGGKLKASDFLAACLAAANPPSQQAAE